MTLNKNIRQTIQMVRDTLPPELNTMIEQGAGEISALEIAEKALKIGDKIPEFKLQDRNGESKSLNEYISEGPLVVTFYRGIWCPYCNLQLAAYNQRLDEIKALGANLVAITPEGSEGVAVLEDSELPQQAKDTAISNPDFDVLHDKNNKVADTFGLVFKLPQAHRKLFEMMKLDIERANGEGSFTFSDPATYIIGQDALVKWRFVPNNYRKRAEPDEILNQLRLNA